MRTLCIQLPWLAAICEESKSLLLMQSHQPTAEGSGGSGGRRVAGEHGAGCPELQNRAPSDLVGCSRVESGRWRLRLVTGLWGSAGSTGDSQSPVNPGCWNWFREFARVAKAHEPAACEMQGRALLGSLRTAPAHLAVLWQSRRRGSSTASPSRYTSLAAPQLEVPAPR